MTWIRPPPCRGWWECSNRDSTVLIGNPIPQHVLLSVVWGWSSAGGHCLSQLFFDHVWNGPGLFWWMHCPLGIYDTHMSFQECLVSFIFSIILLASLFLYVGTGFLRSQTCLIFTLCLLMWGNCIHTECCVCMKNVYNFLNMRIVLGKPVQADRNKTDKKYHFESW